MNQQLPLAIQLNDEATLADFNWAGNRLVEHQLQEMLDPQHNKAIVYLWTSAGNGKSHLLQACCQALPHADAVYLPLATLKDFSPAILEGLDANSLICIDDVDAIAGLPEWEEALFHFYNRIRDREHGKLLISAKTPPANAPITLADLKSRLSWGIVVHVNELNDEDKIMTLQNRAEKRGFELPASVAQFLINRAARNMHDLLALLNRLDEISLAAQRKITIPFVKQALGL